MRLLMSCLLVWTMAACSAAQLQKDQAVLIKLKADAMTVLVTGCANLPATEVLISTVMQFVPAGTTKDAAAAGLTLTGTVAHALCASLATPGAPGIAPGPAPSAS